MRSQYRARIRTLDHSDREHAGAELTPWQRLQPEVASAGKPRSPNCGIYDTKLRYRDLKQHYIYSFRELSCTQSEDRATAWVPRQCQHTVTVYIRRLWDEKKLAGRAPRRDVDVSLRRLCQWVLVSDPYFKATFPHSIEQGL